MTPLPDTFCPCLSPNYQALTLTYFIGVLLKTQSVEAEDVENVGLLLVLSLVAVFASIVAAVVLEMCTARRWVGTVTHAFKIRYEGKVQEEREVPVSVALSN